MFSITCTTCHARLTVRSRDAIGAILECPKCGSMVQVTPPEGWQDEAQPTAETTLAAAGVGASTGGLPAAKPSSTPSPAVESAETAAIAAPPQNAAMGEATPSAAGIWTSPAELLWRKWLLLGSVPVAGLVVAVGVWSVFFSSRRSEPSPEKVVERPVERASSDRPAASEDEPKPSPDRIDQRWLPDGAGLVLTFRPSQLAELPNSSRLIDQFEEVWRPTVGTVLRGLRLKLEDTRRLTWAATDLAAWPERSVVVIELEPGHDAGALRATGEAVDLHLAGAACRRLPDADWPHPFAIVDQRTIVTGQADLLSGLAQRSEVHLESSPLKRLLKSTAAGADLTLLVDLNAAREASWKLPSALLDVWPAGRQPWHVVWEVPEGLGCRLQLADHLRTELVLVCEGQTAAEKVHAALDELVPAAGEALSAQIESLPERLQAGEITVATAHQYELLAKEALAASRAARWKVADEVVWVWVDWSQHYSALSAAAIESRPAIQADWLAAVREADADNHRRLLAGLGGYRKAEGRFPDAAAGGAVLAPETRLSWIAAMLPYYGHADWHRRLEFGYPWNGPQNGPIARQPLPEVVNPALGPSQTPAGFPVTHYVGVAGFGSDAGRLKADDPRAGVFGYGRRTGLEDIADGAANTLALLGVTKRLGPWAAGGDPTVRALTMPPYVDGPDGFGSGQPDGMLAGMADGSVRFISKDVDPRVLEQLATIDGGRDAPAIAWDPESKLPRLEIDEPEPEPEEPDVQPPEPEPATDLAADVPPDGPGTSPAPIQADVEARLADTIPEIGLRDMPLAEAVELLAAMSSLPVSFDPDALLQLGVTLRDPVTVQLSGATVGRILESVVSSRGLALVVENGQVLVTTPPEIRDTLRQRRYTVSDLSGSDPAAVAELAALVQKLVSPDSWRGRGGRGTIEPDGGALLVMQTGVVHHQILVFCEKLRNARGRPLRSRLDPDRFTLATRRDRAKPTLSRLVKANFHQPTPLIEVLAYLGKLAEADVLIDRLALSTAGLTDQLEATLKVQDQPLAAALDELLGPLGLAYRVIDAGTLQVTTEKALAARLELEFYPAGDLLAGAETAPALVERIKGRVAGSTWSDAGGPGELLFDEPSGHLIVLQSQPVQAAVEHLLSELRN